MRFSNLAKLGILSLGLLGSYGCGQPTDRATSPKDNELDQAVEEKDSAEQLDAAIGMPATFELNAEKLLASALTKEQLEEGWVRLFDEQSLFGWFVVGKADWHIEDGVIGVSRGEKSFLCTSFQLSDYELKIDFRADPKTNSGVFLRTGPQPENVAEDCLELNIAPTDNPFPTGSFVQRAKLEPKQLDELLEGEFDPTQWHTYHVKLIGKTVTVLLDGKEIMALEKFDSLPSGHISLQHNEGKVEFRNILLKPVNLQALKMNEEWEKDWTQQAKGDAPFEVKASSEGLVLKGGLGQLQSNYDFGDFFLQASYSLRSSDVNSGIFFRCIRDNMLDGYECQVNHAITNEDPLRPADAGAGGIFRRQDARIVVGDGTDHDFISVLANGAQVVTWVNGIQVADFFDSRPPDENPRRGLRIQPGPVSLQGHDADTEVTFHSVRVAPL